MVPKGVPFATDFAAFGGQKPSKNENLHEQGPGNAPDRVRDTVLFRISLRGSWKLIT